MKVAGVSLALAVGVVGPLLGSGDAERGTAAIAQQMNHAAVVVDTGDGVVRKMCLAFPEAEIDGIEALRRVDTRPSRFQTFGSRGVAVCMRCGVGCPDGDCFCNPEKFWAYHRAGPGDGAYALSSTGAGATKVRNGDVEAWRWGGGEPPPKTTVSEVCNVDEPPARASAATTTTATPTTGAPTTTSQSPATSTPTPSPTSAPTSTPDAPRPAAPGTPPAQPATEGPPATTPTEVAEAPPETGAEEAVDAPSGAEVKRSLGAEEGTAAEARAGTEGRSAGQLAGLGAFAALLGGLLVWRSRLRRAKVRRVRPVR